MKAQKRDGVHNKALEDELTEMLAPTFSGMTVEVGHSDKWNRTSVSFRWSGFSGLLPEERFQRLVGVIPNEFRESRMAGVVWLELTPDESVEQFLKLPRCEDVAGREAEIYATLTTAGFFGSLAEAMGASPGSRCRGGFTEVEAVMSAKKFTAAGIGDARLLFIRYGAYCDCQVLQTARRALADLPQQVASA